MTSADFNAWLKANPKVWNQFVAFTFEMIGAGHRHYSADSVLHRIRWETDTKTTLNGQAAGRALKLNNNLTPFLARHFHDVYPTHRDFFRTRQTREDEADALPPITSAHLKLAARVGAPKVTASEIPYHDPATGSFVFLDDEA